MILCRYLTRGDGFKTGFSLLQRINSLQYRYENHSKSASQCKKFLKKYPSWKILILWKFDWTCLLPVPANVLLGHGRVKQKVCVFKEGWDGRGASALELFVIVPWNHLNPYQSPLVQGDSRCSVDIRSGKEWSLWDILMLWRLTTWQKVGKLAQSHCQASHGESH